LYIIVECIHSKIRILKTHCLRILVEDIDFLDIDESYVKHVLKPRSIYSRKGDNGIVLVLGGSRLYHGAPILSSLAALRSGVDLVYTAVPKINVIATRTFSPDLIVIPLPDDKLTMGSSRRLLSSLPKKVNTAAIGMGLHISNTASICFVIEKLLDEKIRLVLDAASLTSDILSTITSSNSIVTPHAGEFKRLFGLDVSKLTRDDQINHVVKMAREYGIVIVLKGYFNIVSNGDKVSVLERTSPSMTVGGTGDILAGLIAGLLTTNNSFESSILALYFNGIAALNLQNRLGMHFIASDLLLELPLVMRQFDSFC
jgi:ADP-dependent NAD(P)H-hydrate dehydratase